MIINIYLTMSHFFCSNEPSTSYTVYSRDSGKRSLDDTNEENYSVPMKKNKIEDGPNPVINEQHNVDEIFCNFNDCGIKYNLITVKQWKEALKLYNSDLSDDRFFNFYKKIITFILSNERFKYKINGDVCVLNITQNFEEISKFINFDIFSVSKEKVNFCEYYLIKFVIVLFDKENLKIEDLDKLNQLINVFNDLILLTDMFKLVSKTIIFKNVDYIIQNWNFLDFCQSEIFKMFQKKINKKGVVANTSKTNRIKLQSLILDMLNFENNIKSEAEDISSNERFNFDLNMLKYNFANLLNNYQMLQRVLNQKKSDENTKDVSKYLQSLNNTILLLLNRYQAILHVSCLLFIKDLSILIFNSLISVDKKKSLLNFTNHLKKILLNGASSLLIQ
ncbi:hypothetical protein A0H76_1791 [Hepatospora eriocheir]|uniref:Uncharacterized protein n=1 Tax=Hepatospora eriocheir TaxID=1081669 RepID=A0A1X0QKG3_9MICR|nr:hypothetical protein A0H76_1791 [Hepatospora eriocheir]